MKALKNLLTGKKINQKVSLDDKTIFYLFKKVIKDEFGNIGSDKFLPDYFSNKTIFVRSDSAAWKAELWLQRGKIIKKINAELGYNALEEIKFK